MKYMGSKRSMLTNGLGHAIESEIDRTERFVDLFTGSAAVAWHVATRWNKEVIAADLQQFAAALAASVISRTETIRVEEDSKNWLSKAKRHAEGHSAFKKAISLQRELRETSASKIGAITKRARDLAEAASGPVMRAYGGYYYSPLQAIWIDALRRTTNTGSGTAEVRLAALLHAASKCAAAPGHTAQPFKPNRTAGPFLAEAWNRDICEIAVKVLADIGALAARKKGKAIVSDACDLAQQLKPGDLAFIDPPYSAVHYSRFYHVLETIAGGNAVEVSGTGRYPPASERPRSAFSVATEAEAAFEDLFEAVANSGASAIVTFPDVGASNGVSGDDLKEIAASHFKVAHSTVSGRFSTLGGNRVVRAARHSSKELILTLRPK